MQILLKELSSQKRIIDKLEDTIEALVKRSGRSWSPLTGRQQEVVSLFIDIQASARERRDELLDRLNEVWLSFVLCSLFGVGNNINQCSNSQQCLTECQPDVCMHVIMLQLHRENIITCKQNSSKFHLLSVL